jgi:uncharacterized protein with GYD domain
VTRNTQQPTREVKEGMIFITLARFKTKPTKEMVAKSRKLFKQMEKEGGKVLGFYYTLGRYDTVGIMEGKDEKTAMKALLRWGDIVSTETLLAVPQEEARKLVE